MPIDAVTVSGAARASAPPRDAARVAWLGVAVYAGWCLRDFLQDGLPVGFDAHSHLARVSFAARAFAAGHYPGWVNDWYGGFRPLEFYGPAWYWLAAAVGLALRDVVLAVKLVVWAAQVASAVLLFAFTKRVTGRTLPAVLAAVLFIYSARGIPFGAYPQGSPLAAQVRLALWGLLADDLARVPAKVSEDSLDLLYLDHVEFVVARPTLPPGTRRAFPVAAADPGWRTMLQLPHASPAVFAPELAWLPESLEETGARDLPPRLLGVLERRWRNDPSDSATMGSLDPLFRIRTGRDWEVLVPYLRGMQLDRTRARAERIFVDTRLPPGTSVSTDPGDFAVLSHDEEPTRVRIVARASRDGFVRLSYSYDPDAIVALDGAPIEAVADSLGGAITLAFPEGTHVVEVGAPPPNLQKGLLWLSGFLALVLMTVLVRSGQRRDAANGGTMDSLPAIPSVRF